MISDLNVFIFGADVYMNKLRLKFMIITSIENILLITNE